MIKEALSLIIILMAIPAGILLSNLTKDEKKLYRPYFPLLIILFAIFSALSFLIKKYEIALTFAFMLLLILVWYKRK
jgi:hypothetical protein